MFSHQIIYLQTFFNLFDQTSWQNTLDSFEKECKSLANITGDFHWWNEELEGWKLLRALLNQNHSHVERVNPSTDLLTDAERATLLVDSNMELRKMIAIKGWLESCYNVNTIVFPNELKTSTFIGNLSADSAGCIQKPVDPHLFQSVFICLRKGKIGEAIDYCLEAKQPWLAASISGSMLRCRGESNLSNDEFFGNANRKLWKLTCENAAFHSSDEYEKAIYGLFAGQYNLVKNVCNGWKDELWSLLYCQIIKSIDEQLLVSDMQQKTLKFSTTTLSSLVDQIRPDKLGCFFNFIYRIALEGENRAFPTANINENDERWARFSFFVSLLLNNWGKSIGKITDGFFDDFFTKFAENIENALEKGFDEILMEYFSLSLVQISQFSKINQTRKNSFSRLFNHPIIHSLLFEKKKEFLIAVSHFHQLVPLVVEVLDENAIANQTIEHRLLSISDFSYSNRSFNPFFKKKTGHQNNFNITNDEKRTNDQLVKLNSSLEWLLAFYSINSQNAHILSTLQNVFNKLSAQLLTIGEFDWFSKVTQLMLREMSNVSNLTNHQSKFFVDFYCLIEEYESYFPSENNTYTTKNPQHLLNASYDIMKRSSNIEIVEESYLKSCITSNCVSLISEITRSNSIFSSLIENSSQEAIKLMHFIADEKFCFYNDLYSTKILQTFVEQVQGDVIDCIFSYNCNKNESIN